MIWFIILIASIFSVWAVISSSREEQIEYHEWIKNTIQPGVMDWIKKNPKVYFKAYKKEVLRILELLNIPENIKNKLDLLNSKERIFTVFCKWEYSPNYVYIAYDKESTKDILLEIIENNVKLYLATRYGFDSDDPEFQSCYEKNKVDLSKLVETDRSYFDLMKRSDSEVFNDKYFRRKEDAYKENDPIIKEPLNLIKIRDIYHFNSDFDNILDSILSDILESKSL